MRRLTVSGVVLAAGPSRRFGDCPPKQLAVVNGEFLVRRVVRQAVDSRLAEVIVVVGHAAAAVRAAVEDLGVNVVVNSDFAAGQSSSVRVGLAAVGAASSGAMFLPVDQPGLTSAIIDEIVAGYLRTGGPIVVPAYRGRRGSPVVFDRRLFGELAAIVGDEGGRQLFRRHQGEIVELPLTRPDPLIDIDTPADLRRFGL